MKKIGQRVYSARIDLYDRVHCAVGWGIRVIFEKPERSSNDATVPYADVTYTFTRAFLAAHPSIAVTSFGLDASINFMRRSLNWRGAIGFPRQSQIVRLFSLSPS